MTRQRERSGLEAQREVNRLRMASDAERSSRWLHQDRDHDGETRRGSGEIDRTRSQPDIQADREGVTSQGEVARLETDA